MSKPETFKIDDVEYIRKDSITTRDEIKGDEMSAKTDAEALARLTTSEQIKAEYRRKHPRGKKCHT